MILDHYSFDSSFQFVLTGAGPTETESARRERLEREALYDDALSLYTQHQEAKKKRMENIQQQKDEETALVIAGRPSMNAAMANMSDHMHFNETGLDTEEGADDSEETKTQKRARERRDDRRKTRKKRKAEEMQTAFKPLCAVLQKQVCVY